MSSLQIREFEDKCEKLLKYPVTIIHTGNYYSLVVVFDKTKYLNEDEYNSSLNLFSFTDNQHRNCGMSILSDIQINYTYQRYDYRTDKYIINITFDEKIVSELFKGFLRVIYPQNTTKHSFFTFQVPNTTVDTNLTNIGFRKLVQYKNYNHRTDVDRWIWVLEIPDYKGLDLSKFEQEDKPKRAKKTTVKKATKPVVRRGRPKKVAEIV